MKENFSKNQVKEILQTITELKDIYFNNKIIDLLIELGYQNMQQWSLTDFKGFIEDYLKEFNSLLRACWLNDLITLGEKKIWQEASNDIEGLEKIIRIRKIK